MLNKNYIESSIDFIDILVLSIIPEIWMPVLGYEDYYCVSNLGRVKSIDRNVTSKNGKIHHLIGKILYQKLDSNGYLSSNFSKLGIAKRHSIHVLVAKAFIDNHLNKRTVNHNIGIKTNNAAFNLEWATDSENQKHSYDVLKRKTAWGGKNNKKLWKPVLCVNNGVVYNSVTHAANHFKIGKSSVTKVCKKYKESIYGFKFEYVND